MFTFFSVLGTLTKLNDTQKTAELEKLYATLPALNCQRRCVEACGPFCMTRLEHKRLVRGGAVLPVAKIIPVHTETEQRFTGLGRTFDLQVCPLLKDGLCSMYALRPGICRLWGLTEIMKCPFGCLPERVLTEKEALNFLSKVFELGF